MAGDWLKVEESTPDKPEIAVLARKLGVSQGDAFLEWFRVYRWAGRACPGFVPNLSLADLNMLSGARAGTCEALASGEIAWLHLGSGGITFEKWDRHNGKSAKARALEAEKKRNQRGKTDEVAPPMSRDCPDTSGTSSGPDERRREENRPSKDGRKTVGSAESPCRPSRPSRSSKDGRGDEYSQQSPVDLTDLDWSQVIEMAEAAARKIPPLDNGDRRSWLRFGVLAATAFSEAWLAGTADAASRATGIKKTRQAYFVAALKTKAREQYGIDEPTFTAMVRRIEIPSDVWQSQVLEVRK